MLLNIHIHTSYFFFQFVCIILNPTMCKYQTSYLSQFQTRIQNVLVEKYLFELN